MKYIEFFNQIRVYVKLYNRYRIKARKVKLGAKYDAQGMKGLCRPKRIKKVLLVDCLLGVGDFLYIVGLARKLFYKGIYVSVGTLGDAVTRYKAIPYFYSVFDITKNLIALNKEGYDLIFDLTYVNINYWPERAALLKQLSTYAITCGDVSSRYHLFQEYCDISTCTHISKRMGKIYSQIVGGDEFPIMPFYAFPRGDEIQKEAVELLRDFHREDFVVYFNSLARDNDRCMSDKQVLAVLKAISRLNGIKIILYSKKKINIPNVINMPQMNFASAAKIIQRANAIVSPDTSIVHLGSAFDIPTFAVFCGNDRDYFPQYPMKEVWSPLATNSCIFSCDKPHTFDFPIPLDKVTPISDLNPEMLAKAVEEFLKDLIKKESHEGSPANIN